MCFFLGQILLFLFLLLLPTSFEKLFWFLILPERFIWFLLSGKWGEYLVQPHCRSGRILDTCCIFLKYHHISFQSMCKQMKVWNLLLGNHHSQQDWVTSQHLLIYFLLSPSDPRGFCKQQDLSPNPDLVGPMSAKTTRAGAAFFGES